MFFFKRTTFFYDSIKNQFNITNFYNNIKIFYFFSLYLRFIKFCENKYISFLNNHLAIRFFSMKKFLDNRSFYSFRVLKIYGLGFKVSADSSTIKLDLGWSHALFKSIPSSISVLKKQDKLFIYGIVHEKVSNFSDLLISLYTRSAYQIKGLFDIHEVIKKKIGKQRQK